MTPAQLPGPVGVLLGEGGGAARLVLLDRQLAPAVSVVVFVFGLFRYSLPDGVYGGIRLVEGVDDG